MTQYQSSVQIVLVSLRSRGLRWTGALIRHLGQFASGLDRNLRQAEFNDEVAEAGRIGSYQRKTQRWGRMPER
jgi:hypothetical protein